MKPSLITTLLLLLLFKDSFGQETPNTFADRINYIFQHVDKSQVPSGILKEYGIEFTNLNNYNGTSLNDSNKVSITEWKNLYKSLYTSQVSPMAALPSPESIAAEERIQSTTGNHLLILHYNFNELREDALANNLLTHSNDQLFDVPGRTQSPYQGATAFAIAPSRPIFETSHVVLFTSSFYYSNTGKTLSELYLDSHQG